MTEARQKVDEAELKEMDKVDVNPEAHQDSSFYEVRKLGYLYGEPDEEGIFTEDEREAPEPKREGLI